LDYLANGSRRVSKERIEIFGGGKTAILDDFRRLTLSSDKKQIVIRSRLRQDKGHKHAWCAFLQAVREGGPAPIPYPDLWAVANASIMAQKSLYSRENEPIVPAK
jgi:hypothetical protein